MRTTTEITISMEETTTSNGVKNRTRVQMKVDMRTLAWARSPGAVLLNTAHAVAQGLDDALELIAQGGEPEPSSEDE